MGASWLSELARPLVILSITLLIVVWLAIRRNWAAVIYVVMTVPGGWFFGSVVVKSILGRARPEGVNAVPLPGDASMPSGHTLGAFLLLATVCVVVMLNAPVGSHMKRWMAATSTVIIVAVGFARVYLGVHWFGDVLAAWLLGGAWWSFTTATYFGSVTETRKALRSGTQSTRPDLEANRRA
jgi:undecaprenyl-diphosphatase